MNRVYQKSHSPEYHLVTVSGPDVDFVDSGKTPEEALNSLLTQVQSAISNLDEIVDEIQELKKCTKSS